jgi:methionyl-tRNA formyltransferase
MMAPSVKVVAVTQDDPFFTGRFFDTFLTGCAAAGVQVVEIVLLRNFNESRPALARRLWRLYGTVDFMRLLGRYVAARLAERAGRARSVEALAARHGVPVRRLATINDQTYLATLPPRGVTVLLSVAAPEIFRKAALAAVPHVLNVHSGKLPRYRGMMPTFWALQQGDPEVVITVHTMAPKLDAGAIVAEIPMAVMPGESAFDVSARAKAVGGREVALLLARLGTAAWPEPRELDMAGQRYFGFPTGTDARRLRAAGRSLL